MAETEGEGAAYEVEHVHNIYDQISSHFSSTRYKPWPIVSQFLLGLPTGSIGLDIGCGNGKYLTVNRDIFIIASDRSPNLATIAAAAAATTTTTTTTPSTTTNSTTPHDVLLADTLALPHPGATFDFAICIAVLHHLSTPARRIAAVRDILATLRRGRRLHPPAPPSVPLVAAPGGGGGGSSSISSNAPTGPSAPSGGAASDRPGQALIFVWALEQKGSRRGWDAGDAQDVMVPWIMGSARGRGQGQGPGLAREGGGEGEGEGEGARMVERRADEEKEERPGMPVEVGAERRTFLRYYHLYRAGELEDDVRAAGGEVVEAGYERDNWWVIAERAKEVG